MRDNKYSNFTRLLILPLLILFLLQCQKQNVDNLIFSNEYLKIIQITDNTYQHVSYLDIKNSGPFPCNGLIFQDGNKAVVFDTPPTEEASVDLLSWISDSLECKVEAVIVNHHHIDCVGGLEVFHDAGIKSYGNAETELLAKEDSLVSPQFTFGRSMTYKLNNRKVLNFFPGQGHSSDNIVSYIPSENVLFGGCLIKELGAGKGNLNDANLNEWSNTVRGIKTKYPTLKSVIPGHGKAGGIELLDYTIDMFEVEKKKDHSNENSKYHIN
jgi:metallo-beta-lactamase class B